ncbi:hypothetical protein GLOTRDRAFT_90321 [Gloeophyllum trabeum ATCC 11539]|uniref:Uncharacterized protein n=1 Tax=Gloeophyllum trabeum (strain ATCC 11539 / FP-39264 / Madison 617) TaxID=670483 RepID=S7QNC0_GLOTA|nr:uncharacterized protein GLOTRDRAFT_90321 [Gloeophyllum trabeum ATCC 11539]EPQ61011.1 hypothetical protein GLOTRDRAFT_90321 [Gloeophyllum trabeum ATCC 11539]
MPMLQSFESSESYTVISSSNNLGLRTKCSSKPSSPIVRALRFIGVGKNSNRSSTKNSLKTWNESSDTLADQEDVKYQAEMLEEDNFAWGAPSRKSARKQVTQY